MAVLDCSIAGVEAASARGRHHQPKHAADEREASGPPCGQLLRWRAVDYIVQAFPGIAELSELERPTFDRGDRQSSGQAAIALAAERFGYPIGGIDLVIGPHRDLRTAIGVAEVPANPWSWKVEGDQIHFITGEAPPEGPRRIHLTEVAFDSDDSLA